MKIKMTAIGAQELAVQLRNTAKTVEENSRKEMHRAADRIVKQAKLNAPVDEGNLEESIRKERSTGARGRLQLDVVAGDGATDRYAVIMHESDYKLGPRSREKQAAIGGMGRVGRKFLERAATKEKKTIREEIAGAVSRTINSLFSKVSKRLGR